jgi:UDP-glucose 4-epimerase
VPDRALVTGGAGFIGSHLVDRLLAEGWGVDVVDDLSTGSLALLADARADQANDFTFHRLDVRSDALLDLMARRRPAVVFHLAAATDVAGSLARPVADADVNVLGSLNVLEGARAAGARKVVFASGAFPDTPSGVAKAAVEAYLAVYRSVWAIEFTSLVLGSVYGPRMPDGPLVSVAGRVLRGDSLDAVVAFADSVVPGGDYVFVDDVVDAFARAAERGGGLVLSVGSGAAVSAGELVAAMAAAVGLEALPAGLAGEGVLALDPTRAGIHLGWKPWTGLAEGVRALLQSL